MNILELIFGSPETEEHFQQTLKELGFESYSPSELLEIEQAERDAYNEAIAAAVFFGGCENEYQDYDGVWRSLSDDSPCG